MIKLILTSLLIAFSFTGCLAPWVVTFNPEDMKEAVTHETYKVENTSIQIKDLSEEVIEKKLSKIAARAYQLKPKAMNFTAAEESFGKYFKNIKTSNGDIVIESKIVDFQIEQFVNMLTMTSDVTTGITMDVKVLYKNKILINKTYNDKEFNAIIATKNNLLTNDILNVTYKQLAMNMVDIYQEQIIPDLLKALKGNL
ncbi:MAG: hypothetical protein AB7U51_11675 [Arcobacter sp.]|uniref:hypothetical protein n=1 Tax=Arcobacter sp. TaxID=1872629 RepID=UPI003D008F6C